MSGEQPASPATGAPVVFVGSSLSHGEARAFAPCVLDLRRPIRRGDIEGMPAGSVVGVIDGVFHAELAVSARELLSALRRGVTIYGASSMGALRAAELHGYGMIGVGEVFEMYRRGEIDSDAEVALVMDQDTSRALTEPLVNVRYALRQAVADGVLGPEDARRILQRAQGIHYTERTYPLLLRQVRDEVDTARVAAFEAMLRTRREELDIKRLDAVRLLRTMGGVASARPREPSARSPSG